MSEVFIFQATTTSRRDGWSGTAKSSGSPRLAELSSRARCSKRRGFACAGYDLELMEKRLCTSSRRFKGPMGVNPARRLNVDRLLPDNYLTIRRSHDVPRSVDVESTTPKDELVEHGFLCHPPWDNRHSVADGWRATDVYSREASAFELSKSPSSGAIGRTTGLVDQKGAGQPGTDRRPLNENARPPRPARPSHLTRDGRRPGGQLWKWSRQVPPLEIAHWKECNLASFDSRVRWSVGINSSGKD